MAKTKTETATKPVVTRAAKKDATKKLIKQVLEKSALKSNDLIDEAAKLYAAQFGGEENENPNDVKGRIGSVLDVMKKEGELQFDGGVYALKAEQAPKTEVVEKPQKTKKTVKAKAEKAEESVEEEKPKAKRATKKKEVKAEENSVENTENKAEEKTPPLPAAPLQPIAPVAPITPETAPEPIPEKTPKKRGRKAKAVESTETPVELSAPQETAVAVAEENSVEKAENKAETQALQAQPVVMDMSFLFGEVKSAKKDEKKVERKEEKTEELKAETTVKTEPKKEEKAIAPVKTVEKEKTAQKTAVKKQEKQEPKPQINTKPRAPQTRQKTADEKLQEAFLKRLRTLGGDYFEYYSVYLLEKYSRRNGRRLESLKISGGDHDGGIDGEIELTDRLGFRETIYIQAKNWDPDKGDERLWTVGETLLQQFIGACVCRQAKEGKQHCRGIFITTSRFTAEAKRILDEMQDKFIGYDGADLYETAKECEFGIIKKNGEWVLDENLLSGEKALFHIF